MPTCVPTSELKDTAAFSRKVKAAEDYVIVTKNGYEDLIVMTPEEFKRYRLETPEEHLIRLLDEGERDIRAGNVVSNDELMAKLRARYDSAAV